MSKEQNGKQQQKRLGRGLSFLYGSPTTDISDLVFDDDLSPSQQQKSQQETSQQQRPQQRPQQQYQSQKQSAQPLSSQAVNDSEKTQSSSGYSSKDGQFVQNANVDKEISIPLSKKIKHEDVTSEAQSYKRYSMASNVAKIDQAMSKSGFSEQEIDSIKKSIILLPAEDVVPNPDQPRTIFNEEDIITLAESIQKFGILQPILVRKTRVDGKRKYQIVAGERRYRAALVAGLTDVPCVIKELEDREVLEISIIENVQRVDLNPMEEARSYKKLISDFGHTQEQISKTIGKSRSHIANMIRLLDLPFEVQQYVEQNLLSVGHAKVLLSANNSTLLAKEAVENNLTVRDLENIISSNVDLTGSSIKSIKKKITSSQSRRLYEIEEQIQQILPQSIGVQVKQQGSNAGTVTLKYSDDADLQMIMGLISIAKGTILSEEGLEGYVNNNDNSPNQSNETDHDNDNTTTLSKDDKDLPDASTNPDENNDQDGKHLENDDYIEEHIEDEEQGEDLEVEEVILNDEDEEDEEKDDETEEDEKYL